VSTVHAVAALLLLAAGEPGFAFPFLQTAETALKSEQVSGRVWLTETRSRVVLDAGPGEVRAFDVTISEGDENVTMVNLGNATYFKDGDFDRDGRANASRCESQPDL
jgi:hypothetical protein